MLFTYTECVCVCVCTTVHVYVKASQILESTKNKEAKL